MRLKNFIHHNSIFTITKIENLGFNNDQAEKRKVLQELSAMDEQVTGYEI